MELPEAIICHEGCKDLEEGQCGSGHAINCNIGSRRNSLLEWPSEQKGKLLARRFIAIWHATNINNLYTSDELKLAI